jgi:hypothetical protein
MVLVCADRRTTGTYRNPLPSPTQVPKQESQVAFIVMEGRSGSARWGHDGYLNREHSRIEAEGKTSRRRQISFISRMLIRIREHEETKRKDSIGAVTPLEAGKAYQASTAARHHIDFLSIFRIRPLTRKDHKV